MFWGARRIGDRELAWGHLERAHILSQRYFTRHWHTHWLMLRLAREERNRAEVRGQIRRLAAVPLGWAGGWVPKGNTGGANVHPLKPMSVEGDLAEALEGYSPWKDVAVRVAVVVTVLLMVLWARSAWSEVRERNGEFLTVTASAASQCTPVPALEGAEDIVLDTAAGRGFAVGGDRRAFRGGGAGRSRVFAFPADDPHAARDTTPDEPAELKGFGADLLRKPDGSVWLGIANRSNVAHGIEVYAVAEDGFLTHYNTLTSPDFRNPNDLVLLSPSSALVTLDKRSPAGTIWEVVEGARRAATGRVVHLEQGSMETIADGLLSSNGIVRLDNGRVAVGELVGRRVSIFAPNSNGDAYQLERRIALPFAVDNLTSPDGRTLWAAGHPKLLTLARGYQRDEEHKSPSMAVAVDSVTGTVRTLFQDDGHLLSASSVAVALPDKRMLVGTAFGPAATLCEGRS
ncbi:hypothetical protein GCM10007854_04480 [Algimonas porphyrae]|uniref:Strictosidine synthase conserved region domain-containing protein n=2 Tax=Algimonas porphyrae TaxID=1128113 RepID=A0ABQ5UY52_9PROT|nr:hypothetical protein GCM10007854_04480 [Algimonas porphyrae]